MPLLFIQTSISLGNIAVVIAVVAGAIAFRQIGPVGGSTVEMWQSRCEILERERDDLKAMIADFQAKNDVLTQTSHEAELTTKDRERTIAELQARPDTQKMLDAFEMNQAAVLKVLADISTNLVELATGVANLIHREQDGRSSDS